MTALEKMISSMLGVTPEKMQETMASTMQLLGSLSDKLEKIENDIGYIKSTLEKDNDNE